MPTATLTVSEKVKAELKQFPWVNWSEVARQELVQHEKSREAFEQFNAIMDYIPQLLWFFGKTSLIVFLMMWFKWTFPRLRIDQLLTLEWKYLMPLNLINLIIMALVVYFGLHW